MCERGWELGLVFWGRVWVMVVDVMVVDVPVLHMS